jgi:acetyl-CoA carboxylase biotin carboxylase subunit
LVHQHSELAQAIVSARREAQSAFGDGTLMLERLILNGRHIEIQVFADAHGNAVYVGERDCTSQRRRQKVIEEAPSPVVSPEMRASMGKDAVAAALAVGYRGAGTIEFLWENGEFYFIEMNTRLQVEHPVTEAITGVDLVREQIRIADGKPLSVAQEDIEFNGHAIECRINAEDPWNFAPSPGLVQGYHAAGGMNVRVDSGLYAGYKIPPYYDSMIAKLIVKGRTREGCIMRLKRALEEMVVTGVKTSIPLHQALMNEPDFIHGDYTIKWLEEWLAQRSH